MATVVGPQDAGPGWETSRGPCRAVRPGLVGTTRARRVPPASEAPIRVVRIVTRLNIGGVSLHVIGLTRRLEEHGYETTLVRGREEPDEGNMDYLAEDVGIQPVLLPWMRRNPGWRDIPALFSLIRTLRRERPHIVDTHGAKGGTLGRAAALIAFPRRSTRPVLIHTYHGHSLIGYFEPRTASFYRRIEQLLAPFTDRLVAVSQQIRDELVALGVAPADRFEVVPYGFDLSAFTVNGSNRSRIREQMRAQLGIPPQARVVTLIARLVPIKRVDRFLNVANLLRDLPDVRFLIVGDGELRQELQSSPDAQALDGRLIWAGFRRDMPAVVFASDVVVQTSDNEGTPISLIEAQAAGVPVVSTDVGGTAMVVEDGGTGYVVPRDVSEDMAAAVDLMLGSPKLHAGMAKAARERTPRLFSVERLVGDLDEMYRRLLGSR